MLLRRVIEHVKSQHWTAVALDFVIVVAGVFIGIQVSNWNDAREDRARERQYIERLSRDFQNIIQRSELALELWQGVVGASERLIDDVEAYKGGEENQRPMIEIQRDLDLATSGQIPAPQAPTFVELLSAGEVGLIRSVGVRDALLAYNEQAHYGLEIYRALVSRTESANNILTEYFEIALPNEARSVYDDSYSAVQSIDTERLFVDARALGALKVIAIAADNHRGLTVVQLEAARAAQSALKEAR